MVIEPASPPSRAGSVTLLGGELAFDFANSESGRGHASHQDHFQRPADIADWLSHAKALGPQEAQTLRGHWADAPEFGAALLRRAKALRGDIQAIGAALAQRRAPPEAPIHRLNAFLVNVEIRIGFGFEIILRGNIIGVV